MSTTKAEMTGLQFRERDLCGAFNEGPLARVADVTPDSRVGQEEIFGPVALIMRYSTVDEAIEIRTLQGRAVPLWPGRGACVGTAWLTLAA